MELIAVDAKVAQKVPRFCTFHYYAGSPCVWLCNIFSQTEKRERRVKTLEEEGWGGGGISNMELLGRVFSSSLFICLHSLSSEHLAHPDRTAVARLHDSCAHQHTQTLPNTYSMQISTHPPSEGRHYHYTTVYVCLEINALPNNTGSLKMIWRRCVTRLLFHKWQNGRHILFVYNGMIAPLRNYAPFSGNESHIHYL